MFINEYLTTHDAKCLEYGHPRDSLFIFAPRNINLHHPDASYTSKCTDITDFWGAVFWLCYGQLDSKGEFGWWDLLQTNSHGKFYTFCDGGTCFNKGRYHKLPTPRSVIDYFLYSFCGVHLALCCSC